MIATATSIILVAAGVLLAAAGLLVLVRLGRGPGTLDRVVAVDVMVATAIAALALEAAIHHHATTLPVMLVLALLGFAGSLSLARFVESDRQLR